MIIKILFYFIFLFSFLTQNIYSLTFKSDGSIIASNGEQLKKSYADRFQIALEEYYENKKINNWEIVKLNKSGRPNKVLGFMGEKFLLEGFPLFALPNNFSNDPIKDISYYNGLLTEDFIQIVIANSSEKWSKEKGLDKSVRDSANKYVKNLLKNNFEGFKLVDLSNKIIQKTNYFKNHNEFFETEEFKEISFMLKNYFSVDLKGSREIILNEINVDVVTDDFALRAYKIKNTIEQETGKNFEINFQDYNDLNLNSAEIIKLNIKNENVSKEVSIAAKEAASEAAEVAAKEAASEAAEVAAVEAVNESVAEASNEAADADIDGVSGSLPE